MASITLFSIYLLYKYFADKMYYFVTGYFFLLGVAAVTGKNRVGYLYGPYNMVNVTFKYQIG